MFESKKKIILHCPSGGDIERIEIRFFNPYPDAKIMHEEDIIKMFEDNDINYEDYYFYKLFIVYEWVVIYFKKKDI